MMVEVHDESYARLHLGNMGENMDYFDARICFKGGSKYNINILKVLTIVLTLHAWLFIGCKYMHGRVLLYIVY